MRFPFPFPPPIPQCGRRSRVERSPRRYGGKRTPRASLRRVHAPSLRRFASKSRPFGASAAGRAARILWLRRCPSWLRPSRAGEAGTFRPGLAPPHAAPSPLPAQPAHAVPSTAGYALHRLPVRAARLLAAGARSGRVHSAVGMQAGPAAAHPDAGPRPCSRPGRPCCPVALKARPIRAEPGRSRRRTCSAPPP